MQTERAGQSLKSGPCGATTHLTWLGSLSVHNNRQWVSSFAPNLMPALFPIPESRRNQYPAEKIARSHNVPSLAQNTTIRRLPTTSAQGEFRTADILLKQGAFRPAATNNVRRCNLLLRRLLFSS